MKSFYIILFFILLSLSSIAQLPSFTVTVYDSSSTGYYFLSSDLTAMILDGKGSIVYYRPGIYGNDFKVQPNGLMSYSHNAGYYFMDSTFTVVDSIETKNLDVSDRHDLQVLPNGHFLLLGADHITMDLSAYYFKGQFGSANATVKCSVLQEQDANRNVVFEWHSKDYFSFDEADTFFLFHTPVIDWSHFNSVELDTDGNLLICIRNFDEIIKVNRADSSLMWVLGGKQNQFTFVNSPVPFYGQHDIRRIANSHITLYDNGNNAVPHGARGLEYELDEVNKIATLAWNYTYDSLVISNSKGNVQRLGNTNTLVNFGSIDNDSVCFVVVDTAGTKVFQLDGLVSYRAYNYPSLPWQLNRPQITCFDSLGITYLDAGAGYPSYAWNTGDTDRIIPLHPVPGSYYVFVPIGQGGFISSEEFVVTDTLNLCGNVAVPEIKPGNKSSLNVFPNPSHDLLTVSIDAPEKGSYTIQLADAEGRKVLATVEEAATGRNAYRLNLRHLAKGVYILTVQSAGESWKTKVVVE